MNPTSTTEEAVVALIDATRDAIKGLGSVPGGHLYAMLMRAVTLDEYQAIIGILVSEGDVELKGDVLHWVGPAATCPDCGEPECDAGCVRFSS